MIPVASNWTRLGIPSKTQLFSLAVFVLKLLAVSTSGAGIPSKAAPVIEPVRILVGNLLSRFCYQQGPMHEHILAIDPAVSIRPIPFGHAPPFEPARDWHSLQTGRETGPA
jgi:hypothetical protein